MEPKPDDTRSRLLHAAGEVFAERGFEAASIREICSRAGANLAAVNYHFRDKQGLYTEVIKAAACTPAAEEELSWPPRTSPETKLRNLIAARLAAMLSSNLPSWADQIMVRAMAEPTQSTLEYVVRSVRPKYKQLFEVVAELLPPRTPAADVHLAGISVIAQCMHFRIMGRITELVVGEDEYRGYTFQRIADHITRFSLAALGHGAALSHKSAQPRAPHLTRRSPKGARR